MATAQGERSLRSRRKRILLGGRRCGHRHRRARSDPTLGSISRPRILRCRRSVLCISSALGKAVQLSFSKQEAAAITQPGPTLLTRVRGSTVRARTIEPIRGESGPVDGVRTSTDAAVDLHALLGSPTSTAIHPRRPFLGRDLDPAVRCHLCGRGRAASCWSTRHRQRSWPTPARSSMPRSARHSHRTFNLSTTMASTSPTVPPRSLPPRRSERCL